MKPNDIMMFDKWVRVFAPGIYEFKTFNLKSKELNKTLPDVNKDEEFIVFVEEY